MLFSSNVFLAFLPVVFCAYWLSGRQGVKIQNACIIVASYVFYGWMDWRLCGLLALSAVCAFWSGRIISDCGRKRLAVGISLAVNLGILCFFKYYNFFAASLTDAFLLIGVRLDVPTLQIVLPIGISFYSFMSIAYTIDVSRGIVKPTRDPFSFFAYMSFFPQLLAGPIGRAPEMLPQFERVRTFDYDLAVDGCRQMLWGFFMKMVIADGCAVLTDRLFLRPASFAGSMLLIGAFMYAIQIYADFAGYSNLAIGCGKLFGVRLRQNFAFPYFATNIADFWRRWHMSLTTWFRDYVYIPLGGSRCSKLKCIRNTFVVFLLSGLWHGANWTFVIWGFVHACLFLPLLILGKRLSMGVAGWLLTFPAVVFAWVFFRAADFHAAMGYFGAMFSKTLFTLPRSYLSMLPWIAVLLVVDWIQRKKEHSLQIGCLPKVIRWMIYLTIAALCIAYQRREAEFIYFQF